MCCEQQQGSKGLLMHGMHNLCSDVLVEATVWMRLARPVPKTVQDLAVQAEKLRNAGSGVMAIVRTYNKVGRGICANIHVALASMWPQPCIVCMSKTNSWAPSQALHRVSHLKVWQTWQTVLREGLHPILCRL